MKRIIFIQILNTILTFKKKIKLIEFINEI